MNFCVCSCTYNKFVMEKPLVIGNFLIAYYEVTVYSQGWPHPREPMISCSLMFSLTKVAESQPNTISYSALTCGLFSRWHCVSLTVPDIDLANDVPGVSGLSKSPPTNYIYDVAFTVMETILRGCSF